MADQVVGDFIVSDPELEIIETDNDDKIKIKTIFTVKKKD